jgi:NAD dependent epimerase/dehydratase family enzyme
VLLASQRALPVRLQDAGFEFTHADLESALRTALDRSR